MLSLWEKCEMSSSDPNLPYEDLVPVDAMNLVWEMEFFQQQECFQQPADQFPAATFSSHPQPSTSHHHQQAAEMPELVNPTSSAARGPSPYHGVLLQQPEASPNGQRYPVGPQAMQLPLQEPQYCPILPQPRLVIVEQPTQRTRFRYKSEKGSHGGLTGKSSTPSKKTQPRVKLENYGGPASDVVVRASLYTSDDPPRLHVHRLSGKTCQEDGTCTVPLHEDMTATFIGMGILFEGKKDVPEVLFRRKKHQAGQLTSAEERRLREEAEREAKDINLNCVRLCFEAFFKGGQKPLCEPVLSSPISNQKSPEAGELKISRMSLVSGTCEGGDEVFLLCDKVSKKDIRVKFTQVDEEGNEVWSDLGRFTEADVHHQVAIVFRTPAYRDPDIRSPVEVQVQLYRQTDGETSDPKTFVYRPRDDHDGIERKRKKASPPHHGFGGLQESPGGYEGHFGPSGGNDSKPNVARFAGGMSCPPPPPPTYGPYGHQQAGDEPTSEDNQFNLAEFLVLNQPDMESARVQMSPAFSYESEGPSASPMSTLSSPYSTNPPSNDPLLSSTLDPEMEELMAIVQEFPPDLLDEDVPEFEMDSAAMPKRMARGHPVVTTKVATAKMADLKLDEEEKDEVDAPKSSQPRVPHPDWLKHPIGQFSSRLARMLRKFVVDADVRHLLTAMRKLMPIPDEEGDNCIHLAVIHQPNRPSLLKAILTALGTSCPVLVNFGNHLGQTPLHLAALVGSPVVTTVLLSHRADPKCRDRSGDTPLHLAASKGQADCLRALTSSKASSEALYVQNFKGFTPLHLSVIHGHLKCVEVLCEAMLDTNVADGTSGRTPLHWAVEMHPACVDILLVKGAADTDTRDFAGNTPLHLACALGRSDVARLLVQAGADPSAENHDRSIPSEDGNLRGWTPQDFAGDDTELRNVLAGHPIIPQQGQASGSTVDPPPTTTAKVVADERENEPFDSGFISREMHLLDSVTLDKLARMLDPPQEHWKTLGLFLGLDEGIVEGCVAFEDSPTKYIIKHYEGDEGTADGLVNALELAELREAAEMVHEALRG